MESAFEAFHLHPTVAAGVEAAGFTEPTPIQVQAIPPVMKGLDVMGLAQTGTGKTAAYVLPILNRLKGKRPGCVRALIMAPTRELAEQIHQDISTLGRRTGLRSVAVYGGVGLAPQAQKLRGRAEIVVACPGRLLDHIDRGNADLASLEVFVLDEADQMFDMGFFPDIRKILKHIPRERQTLLFSATMPDEIRRLAGEVLREPVTVQVGAAAPAHTVSHALYPVAQHRKTSLLIELLRLKDMGSVLVFTRTKQRARTLGEKLAKAGYSSASLQGNLSQSRRQAALDGFRSGKFQILVATDIAARGIDVCGISHVINFDMPATPDAYIHRIGRTGRAERRGEAFTLITGEDKDMVGAVNRILGSRIEERLVPSFDYGAPAPRVGHEQRAKPVGRTNGAQRPRGRSTGEKSLDRRPPQESRIFPSMQRGAGGAAQRKSG